MGLQNTHIKETQMDKSWEITRKLGFCNGRGLEEHSE